MKRIIRMAAWIAGIACSNLALPADELRYEITVLQEFQRYTGLFERPGIGAILLESNNLSPSHSSKLIVMEGGKSLEVRFGKVRFVGRKDAHYSYEASIVAGPGGAISALTFPFVLDASGLSSGKAVVTLKPPLASLIPEGLNDRIQTKLRTIANPAAQRQVLDHLNSLSASAAATGGTLHEAILLDSYARSGGPAGGSGGDVGEALPVSDQALLILTVLIWIVAVPAAWWYRRRSRRPKAARPAA